MVFHESLSDCKSLQISKTLQDIQDNINSAVSVSDDLDSFSEPQFS